jgi:hypothetical protein
VRIFLSRPTWIATEFQAGMETFMTQLRNLSLDPRTLGVSDYPSKAPLDEVIDILTECKGAIVLGVPQIEVHAGRLKGEALNGNLVLGTEWNQLEAALAYAAGLPIIVVHHNTVSRGIFDRGVLNAYVHSVDLSSPTWSMDTGVNGAICRWKDNCAKGSGNFSRSTQVPIAPEKPTCPNCSTSQKLIYMSPIPSPLSEIAGGEWECSSCKYVA